MLASAKCLKWGAKLPVNSTSPISKYKICFRLGPAQGVAAISPIGRFGRRIRTMGVSAYDPATKWRPAWNAGPQAQCFIRVVVTSACKTVGEPSFGRNVGSIQPYDLRPPDAKTFELACPDCSRSKAATRHRLDRHAPIWERQQLRAEVIAPGGRLRQPDITGLDAVRFDRKPLAFWSLWAG